jgi:hypothetical protein
MASSLALLLLACATSPGGMEPKPDATAPIPGTAVPNASPIGTSAHGEESPAAKRLVVLGTLVAYGSEPHVVWLIKAEDGMLYYPKGKLQALVATIAAGTYEWAGDIEPPVAALPGLIPPHEAAFSTLEWSRIER